MYRIDSCVAEINFNRDITVRPIKNTLNFYNLRRYLTTMILFPMMFFILYID